MKEHILKDLEVILRESTFEIFWYVFSFRDICGMVYTSGSLTKGTIAVFLDVLFISVVGSDNCDTTRIVLLDYGIEYLIDGFLEQYGSVM